jgi:hypothetical protein
MPTTVDQDLGTDIYRGVEAKTEIDCKHKFRRTVINDNSLYRYTSPDLWKWDDFLRTGDPVLFEHGTDPKIGREQIGNVTSLEFETHRGRRSIVAEIDLFDDSDFTKRLKARYLSKKARGWSIRAIPHDASRPTNEEIRMHPDWSGVETIYRSWSLIEVSATNVPGNPGCVSRALRGVSPELAALRGIGESYCLDAAGVCTIWRSMNVEVNGKVYRQMKVVGEADEEMARHMIKKRR